MRAIRAERTFVDGAFVEDACVVIEGDEIVDVLRGGHLATVEVEDWDGLALLPGTVNCHGHAFQNLLKGVADDLPFDRWRDEVLYPISEGLDEDAIYVGALFAFAEAVVAGVTSTVDFFYLHDAGNENAHAVVRAAEDVGIRLVLARAFYDEEAPTRAPARYREPASVAKSRTLSLAEDLAGHPLISVQPAPHSLHAASPATIRTALEGAAELGTLCHLHLAEASYEVDQVRDRYGTTPVRLLHREGVLDPRLVTVHGVWLDDEELDLMAAADAALIHCPGANAFLGDGTARVPEMLARGIRVGLGPDGGCANNKQSVFEEMRMATLMAKARLCDGSALDALAALRLGTASGAEILGLPVGAIEAGRKADLVALNLDDLSLQPTAYLERHVVNSMASTAIKKVMVGGDVVAVDGRPTRVDALDLNRRIAAVTAGWKRPG